MRTTGFVVYDGPSLLTGAAVVAIVTLGSHNAKTGDMAQAWVLCADAAPSAAIADGRDDAICGHCVHRSGGTVGRSCYVTWWLGPTNVYKAFRAGVYRRPPVEDVARRLAGEQLRIAAYGDPAAVPIGVWRRLLVDVASFTAYTHQWRTCDPRFATFAMASVESEREADEAHALGYRTFRTRLARERVRPDEIVCPASDEAGHRTTCSACGLCVGQRRPTARSIVIVSHGRRVAWLTDKKVLASTHA